MATCDYLLKLLLVGDSNVGKTSLLVRFTQGNYNEAKNTVGVDLKVKTVEMRQKQLKLTIWDTAGQERFRTLTASYYRGAHGIILVYDITNRDTYQHIQMWLQEVDIYSTVGESIKMLIGNKIDQEDQRKVSKEEAQNYARTEGMMFMECSAFTNLSVQRAFDELLEKILDSPDLLKLAEGHLIKRAKVQLGPPLVEKENEKTNQEEDNNGGSLCC